MIDKDQLEDYAESLIHSHAFDIEWLTYFEVAEEYFPGHEFTDEDAKYVNELIRHANLTIEFEKDCE